MMFLKLMIMVQTCVQPSSFFCFWWWSRQWWCWWWWLHWFWQFAEEAWMCVKYAFFKLFGVSLSVCYRTLSVCNQCFCFLSLLLPCGFKLILQMSSSLILFVAFFIYLQCLCFFASSTLAPVHRWGFSTSAVPGPSACTCLVNCPTRWSFSYIFVFLYWSYDHIQII